MDVHPPHEPIHSARDFFLHLFTITVGLLIALGLEAAVEHVHHKHLEAEARAEIHAEVEQNRKDLENTLGQYDELQRAIGVQLDLLEALRTHKPTAVQRNPLGFTGATLNSASYATAQNDGAMALMDYSEARQYADVYTLQEEFMMTQRNTFQQTAAPIFGLIGSTKVPLKTLDEAQLDHGEELLEAYRGDLVILKAIGDQLDENYRKF